MQFYNVVYGFILLAAVNVGIGSPDASLRENTNGSEVLGYERMTEIVMEVSWRSVQYV